MQYPQKPQLEWLEVFLDLVLLNLFTIVRDVVAAIGKAIRS